MKLSQLFEARHMSFSKEKLSRKIQDIIWDTFEEIDITDYNNHEDYTDAVITMLMKRIEKAAPPEHKKRLADMVWSVYHDFDESEFADTESLVDAMVNDIATEMHFSVMHRLGI